MYTEVGMSFNNSMKALYALELIITRYEGKIISSNIEPETGRTFVVFQIPQIRSKLDKFCRSAHEFLTNVNLNPSFELNSVNNKLA